MAVIASIAVNATVAVKNTTLKNTIKQKKSDIARKMSVVSNIQKTIQNIEKEKPSLLFLNKTGFYPNFNKQEFLDALVTKMNLEDEIAEEHDKTSQDSEYSGFLIRLDARGGDELRSVAESYKKKFVINNKQNIAYKLESGVVKVSFQADYEYVVYRILNIMQHVLPGYVVVKSISVSGSDQDRASLLYDRSFNKSKRKTFFVDLKNRLNCLMELEWLYFVDGRRR